MIPCHCYNKIPCFHSHLLNKLHRNWQKSKKFTNPVSCEAILSVTWLKHHEIEHPGKTYEGAKRDVFVRTYFLLSNTNYNYMILKCMHCVLLSTDIVNFEQLFMKIQMVFILRGSDVIYGTDYLKVTSHCQQTLNKSMKIPSFALISNILTTEWIPSNFMTLIVWKQFVMLCI